MQGTMLVYVLLASLWSNYQRDVKIEFTKEFDSYDNCVHGAKEFYFGYVKDEPFPGNEGLLNYLNAGIDFEWVCRGYVRIDKR